MNKPLLSICIPTRQRCATLKGTINSITGNDYFKNSDDIEVVISDNASTDDTEKYCLDLMSNYQGKIKYHRNNQDVGDLNFEYVLRIANGKLRKLHNDSFLFKEEFFAEVIPLLRNLDIYRPSIFFANGNAISSNEYSTICTNADDLLSHVGFYITWIGGYCIWEDELLRRHDFGRMAKNRFIQVDNIIRDLENKGKFFIFNKAYFVGQNFGKKIDYNAAEVFGDNLVNIVKKIESIGLLSKNAMIHFKNNLLFNHIIPSHFSNDLGSVRTGFNKYMHHFYEDKDFLDYIENMYFKKIGGWTGDKRLMLNYLVWKSINNHNETNLKSYLDIDKIKVSHRTYGSLNVSSWGAENESLEIGALCSIGDNVNFMLGGNHDLHHVTTYPFKVKLGVAQNEASSKGAIVVEDDVWIGNNCTILSGVRIGRGAVIGTGSVVAKDVPPYAIVVGNPAAVVKFRFSPNVIKQLMKIDLKKLAQLENMESHLGMLYAIVNDDSCSQVIEYFEQLGCLAEDHR